LKDTKHSVFNCIWIVHFFLQSSDKGAIIITMAAPRSHYYLFFTVSNLQEDKATYNKSD